MVLIDSNSTTLAIGDQLPHFMLPAVDGTTIDTRDIDTKALVVVFTCNHCPYAQAVEPRLIALAHAHPDARFILICSNDPKTYTDDSFGEMKKRSEQHGYPFPYCQDESQGVAKSFGALCTPHCFVFDQDKKLQYKGRVDDNWKDEKSVTKRELHDSISALLEGKKPMVSEANAIGCSIKWRAEGQ